MTATTLADGQAEQALPDVEVALGGFAALAESAWMGSVQATEVLEPLRTAPAATLTGRRTIPRLPSLQLRGLATREFSIAEASFILIASFFLSAVLGAIRQILFNAQFGVGADVNAYYAAFRPPDTLFSLIAGGALSSAMIPVLLSTRRQDGEPAAWHLTSLVLTVLLAFFAVIVVTGEVFAPAFVMHVLAPGFDAPTSRLAVSLTRVMLLQPLVLALGSVATAVLNSRNRFLLTGLSVVSHNVTLIAGIAAARLNPAIGIYGPTWGVVAGAVLQAFILLPGLAGGTVKPVWNLGDVRLREIVRLLIPNGLAVGVNYSRFIVDTAFASRAPELAGLPAIYNAWLLVGLPIALLGQTVGQAVFPRLAEHAAAPDWPQMRRTLLRSLGRVIGLAVPALLALVFLGRPVIRILFEHGQFGPAAGDLIYSVLVIYALALPAYVATEVATRGLIALRDTRTSLVTNTAQLIGRALIMTFAITRVGILAIPAALAITATLEALTLSVLSFSRVTRRMTARRLEPS
jgi:putative peptidoglycan lipid II flippase